MAKRAQSILSSVCNEPNGVGFAIDSVPDFLEKEESRIPHVHSFYEVVWLREDCGKHYVDFQEYEVKKDSIFFLSPGQVHHFDGVNRPEGYIIRFCTDFLCEEHSSEDLFIKYHLFNSFESAPYCMLQGDVAGKLENVIRLMMEEVGQEEAYGHLDMLRSLLKQYLVLIHRHSTKCEDLVLIEKKSSHRLFVRFRKLLEQNYKEKHMVKDYADILGISCKTLSNCVLECTGKSPLVYINDRIILEAKRLLLFSTMMTKEVASNLGFEDPSYFAKFFKRETGFLPTTFKHSK